MTALVLPELAAESVEKAERLGQLSAREGLSPDEAEYLLASGLAALRLVPKLWLIIKGHIGGGTKGTTAHALLEHLLRVVDKNLDLARILDAPARIIREESGRAAEGAAGLVEAREQLLRIRHEAHYLRTVVAAPVRWPTAEQLGEAKERMRNGDRLSPEEFRQALLGE